MQYFFFVFGIVLAFATVLALKLKFIKSYKNSHPYLIAIGCSLIISIVLEIFTFNYDAFQTFGEDCKTQSYSQTMNNLTFTKSEEAEPNTYIAIVDNIDTVVKCIDIDFVGIISKAQCTFSYTDDANAVMRTVHHEFSLVPGVPETMHKKLDLAGKTHKLQLTIKTDSFEELHDVSITINQKANFKFNFVRAAFLFFLLFIIMMIKKHKDFNIEFSSENSNAKAFLIILIGTQIIMMLSLAKTSGKDFNLFQNSEYEMDAYQELTVALSHGKVDLNNLVEEQNEAEEFGIEQLNKLDNPYEWAQREGIDYKWDRAFYESKYYCYFGIVPVILFYLPIYTIFSKMINTHFVALLLALIAVIAMAKLTYDIAKRRSKTANLWVLLCAMLGYIHVTMVVFCAPNSNIYEVARLSGMIFSMIGIDLMYQAFDDGKVSKVKIVFGALFMALAVGSRPNTIFASFIVLPIILRGLKEACPNKEEYTNKIKECLSKIFCKENIFNILCFVAPYVVVGLGIMYYNYIRFDSVFEFGAKYQLTVFDTSYYKLTDFSKIPLALYEGFLSMPESIPQFPFFQMKLEHGEYLGYLYQIHGIGLLAYPVMWLLPLLPWSLKRGIHKMKDGGFVITALLVGILSCYITTVMGGTAHSYTVDFAWMIYIPVIYIMFDLYDYAKKYRLQKYTFSVVIALTCATLILNGLLSLALGTTDMANSNPEVFYRLKEMIIFWN